MSGRKTVYQLWHASRGIVFAAGGSVVYPRLPLPRHLSAPAAAASHKGPGLLSAGSETGETNEGLAAGHRLGTAQEPIEAASASTAVPATAAGTEGAAETDEGIISSENSETLASRDTGPDVPPFTPLDFKIPDTVFRDARRAAEGSSQSYWSYSLYRGPGEGDVPGAKVKVHYCTSSHTTERVLQQYFMNEKVLGFDLEWASNALKHWGARHNVSLVQLATPSRVGLFHIAAYPKQDVLVAPSLKKILEDPNITKVGVWIKGDCTRMSHFLGINVRGQFELSHLYKLVKYSRSGNPDLINKKVVALATQVKECLGLPMFKGSDVRTSNWTRPLHMPQVIYSASDAYAAVQLFAVLNHERQNLDPAPPLPHHAELNLPIRTADQALPALTEEENPEPEAIVEDDTVLQYDLGLGDKPGLVDYAVSLDLPGAGSVSLEPERDLGDQPTSVS